MILRKLIAGVLLVGIAACGPVFEAERTDTVSRTLTVREIDKDARRLTVVGDGERYVLRVSEDVRNFEQVEIGDKLNVEFFETVAVSMADPADEGETFVAGDAVVAQEGQKPGAAAGGAISGVVEFVSYDAADSSVVVRMQDGGLVYTKIRPEMRSFAASREPGDRIVVNIVTGLAVGITPAA